ncbi:MAG: MFS transporter [Treponema sp.]|jgi:MFS family permease|nr:MFS transporter [Treponema sp.]
MSNVAQDHKYPKYRWVIAVLFILVTMLDLYFLAVTAPLMSSLMKEFNTSLTVMGYASTIVSTFMGVFMFIGVVIIGKWGVKKCYIISCIALLLGNLICMLSTNVEMFIAGRACIGIGFGVSGTLVASTVYMWFPPKERPMLFTANVMGSAFVQIVAYNITVPLYNTFGIKPVFGVCMALSAVATLAWIILGKEFDINAAEGKVADTRAITAKAGAFDGLKLAFRSKELWVLTLFITCTTLASNGTNFFYPTFLSQVRGLSPAVAGSITSVRFLGNTIGSLVGGAVAIALGRRKPIIMTAAFGLLIGYLSLFNLTYIPVLIAAMFFAGFMNLMTPAVQSAALEVPNMTPAMAAGGNSMMYGFGSLLALFISPILGGLSASIGLTGAMSAYVLTIIVIAAIASFFFIDRGPKVKIKTKQASPAN